MISTDFEAEHFVAQCRREAARFPIRHIDDLPRPARIVSRDFISGCADAYDWAEFSSSGLPSLLRRQAE